MKKLGVFRFISRSIARKLVVTYLVIVFIPMTAGGLIFNNYARQAARKEFEAALSSNLQQLAGSISEKIDSCAQSAGLIRWDKTIVSFLQTKSYSDSDLISAILTDIIPKLNGIRQQNPSIRSLRILQGNADIPMVQDVMYYNAGVENGDWAQKLNRLYSTGGAYDKLYVETSHAEAKYSPGPSTPVPVFTLYKPLYSATLDRMTGIIEVNIPVEKLLSSLMDMNPIGGETLLLLDRDGKALYGSKPDAMHPQFPEDARKGAGSFRQSLNGKPWMLVTRYIPAIDCTLTACLPENELYVSGDIRVLLFSALAVGFVTLSFISLLFSRLLLKDLRRLQRGMEKVGRGDLGAQVCVKSQDEFGRLATIFNSMVGSIHSLMANLEKAGAAEKEAIYKALDNQIKPHFLCNALDMVRATAELDNNMQVAVSISRIMNYFMYNTSKYGKYVSLKDELKNAVDYIEVYNLIGKRHVEYVIDVCDGLTGRLTEYSILKFVLQPIVENCVLHGFRDRTENCLVYVGIALSGDRLTVSVEDNGAGIPADRLEALRAHLAGDTEIEFRAGGNGVGLKNIDERLRMSYGAGYGLEIEGSPGVGTRVTLSFEAGLVVRSVESAI